MVNVVLKDSAGLAIVSHSSFVTNNWTKSYTLPLEGHNRIRGFVTAYAGDPTGVISPNSEGIASVVSEADSTGLVNITYDEAFASNDYFVQLTAGSLNADVAVKQSNLSAAAMQVLCYHKGTGSPIALQTYDASFYIEVSGL
jgi:hypothetical protein